MNGTRANPYFSTHRRGGSANKQPRLKLDSQFINQFQAPISEQKLLIQNSADEQIVKDVQQLPGFQTKYSEIPTPQLRQSPSFKLKNYRHVTPKDDMKRQLKYSKQETYTRKTRMQMLESFSYQFGSDEDVSVIRNTQQTKRNIPIGTPSSQTTTVPKTTFELDDRDNNIEEMHFQFVEMQQKYKIWLENIEKKKHKQ